MERKEPDMTGTEWIFLAGGVFIGALIVAVFDAPRFWAMHEQAKALEGTVLSLTEQVTHLEAQVHPLRWVDDDPQNTLKVRARIYDRYEDLVQPGTTTLGPFGLEEDS